MASDACVEDQNQKILSAAFKFVADINDLRLQAAQNKTPEHADGPTYDQRLEEVEHFRRQDERETKEAEEQLLRASAAIEEKDKKLKDALQAFVTQTQLSRNEVSRLQDDCSRLRSEKQLTEQQKEDIHQRLSNTIGRLLVQSHTAEQKVNHLDSILVERNEQATSQIISMGQDAEKYRRKVEALTFDLHERERQFQDQMEHEQSGKASYVASLQLEVRKERQEKLDNEEATQEALEQNTQLQERLGTYQKETQAAEEKLAKCEKILTSTKANLKDRISQTALLKLDLAKAQKATKEAQKQTSELQKSLSTIEKAKKAAEERLAEHQQRASTMSTKAIRLRQQLTHANTETAKIKQNLIKVELDLANMQREKDGCEVKAKEALENSSQLYEKLTASHKEQTATAKRFERRFAAEKTGLEQELDHAKAEIKNLQERIELADVNMKENEDTQSIQTQTGNLGASTGASATVDDNAGLAPDRQVMTVAGLRSQLAKLVSGASDKSTPGFVVVLKEYARSCREFADGQSDSVPGPLQCPDLSTTYATFSDVKYLNPSAGADLCAMMGGTAGVTVGKGQAWYCAGDVAFRYTALFDDQEGELEIGDRKKDDSVCHLPVSQTFPDALHQYLGYNPTAVLDQEANVFIEPTRFVGSWRTENERLDLIVIKYI